MQGTQDALRPRGVSAGVGAVLCGLQTRRHARADISVCFRFAGVAQSAEQLIRNEQVRGSIPLASFIRLWSNGRAPGYEPGGVMPNAGSSPASRTYSVVAQSEAREPPKLEDAGSSPADRIAGPWRIWKRGSFLNCRQRVRVSPARYAPLAQSGRAVGLHPTSARVQILRGALVPG